jgi:hypothetical protein
MISGIGITVQPSWVYHGYIIGITSTGIQNHSNDFLSCDIVLQLLISILVYIISLGTLLYAYKKMWKTHQL